MLVYKEKHGGNIQYEILNYKFKVSDSDGTRRKNIRSHKLNLSLIKMLFLILTRCSQNLLVIFNMLNGRRALFFICRDNVTSYVIEKIYVINFVKYSNMFIYQSIDLYDFNGLLIYHNDPLIWIQSETRKHR